MHFTTNFPDFVDDVVLKKIYIDTYNRNLGFTMFKQDKGVHEDEYFFPPPCMQDNSYGYLIFWYEWIFYGSWKMSYDDLSSSDESSDSDNKEAKE